MKITLSLLTVFLASAHGAAIPPKPMYHYDLHDRCDPMNLPNTTPKTDPITMFGDNAEIYTDVGPFSKDGFKSPAVMRRIYDRNRAVAYFRYLAKSTAANAFDPYKSAPTIKKWAKSLAPEDVTACSNNFCADMLFHNNFESAWMNMSESAKKAITGSQLTIIFANGPDAAAKKKYVDALPSSYRKAMGSKLMTLVGGDLPSLSPAAIKDILSEYHRCQLLTTNHLTAIIKKGPVDILTPECAKAAAARLSQVDLTPTDSVKINPKVFSLYNGALRETFLQHKVMSGEVFKNFAERTPAEKSPGENLELEKVHADGYKVLQTKLFLGYLRTHSPVPALRVAGLKNLDVGIFTDISAEDVVLSLLNLQDTDYAHLKPTVLQHIIDKYPVLCARFTSAINFATVGRMSEECYRRITDAEARGNALVLAKSLEPTLLMHASGDQIANMQCTLKNDKETGLACTNMGGRHEMMRQVIGYLGEDPDGNDPCVDGGIPKSLFDLSEQYKNVAAAISYRCLAAAERDPAVPEGKKLAPHLEHISVHWSERPKEYWEKMTADILKHHGAGRQFFVQAPKDIFDLLPLEALKGMTSEDVINYRHRAEFSKEQIQAMPDTVFANVPADILTTGMLIKMTPAQIKHACHGSKAHSDLGAIIAADVLKEMSFEQISAIPAKSWEIIAPQAFAGIDSSEKVASITAEATSYWTLEAVKNLPSGALKGLTAAQAAVIGSSVPAANSPVTYLYESSDLSEEAKKALLTRLPADYSGPTSLTWLWISLSAVVILAAAGGVVYWFFFRE